MGEWGRPISWAETRGGLFLDEDNNRVAGMIIGEVSKKEMPNIRYDK